MNYIDLTNGFTTSEISAMGFPSATYEELTLGASGDTYEAVPANGYIYINMKTDASDRISLHNLTKGYGVRTYQPANTSTQLFIPVNKNDTFTILYSGTATVSVFEFFYAQGEI